jgi:fructoselysine-6-P-deglycase FrlB-like protein
MSDPIADRAAALLADILAGPAELTSVLRAQREALRELPLGLGARPTWRFIGMGSSRFAALDAAARLRAVGRDANVEVASASGGSPGGRDVLVVAISASGRTPEVLAAAERHRVASFVVGLTAEPDSPLANAAGAAGAVIPLRGDRAETAGIACLTYRATVAALALLAWEGEEALEPTGFADAPAALASLIDGRDAWLRAAADILDTGREVHVLGDGLRTGSLEQAALMLREAPRISALPFDTGDWLHAGLYTFLPGDAVLLFTGSPADDEAAATIRARGGSIVSVGPPRSDTAVHVPLPADALADPVVRALVEPVVAELLAVELWQRTAARTMP